MKPRVPQAFHQMQDLETYTTADMTQILKWSQRTLYRHLKEARAGRGDNFPLPIQTGPKKSLRWDAETVRKFLQNGSDAPQTSQTLKISSAKSIQIRHAEAMARLERKGVKAAKKRRDN